MADQNLQNADEQMAYYWNREYTEDADLDTQLRQAELLQVIAEASLSIARSLARVDE